MSSWSSVLKHHLSTRFARRAAGLALLAFLVVACRTRYDIPALDDVKEQYRYARTQDTQYRQPLNAGQGEELSKIAIAAWQKVVDEFPNETLSTSRARLNIALIHEDRGRNRDALRIYENLIETCPDDDIIQATAMFRAAGLYDQQNEGEKAKEYYRLIIARFESRTAQPFADLVAGSKRRLLFVRSK